MLVNLDLNDVKAQTGSRTTVVPEGNYPVRVVEFEVHKSNKGGTGFKTYLEITEGENAGSCLMEYICIKGFGEKALKIGHGKLKGMAVAMHHDNPNMIKDTDDLLNKPFMVLVTQEDDEYEGRLTTKNKIKSYSEYDSSKVKKVETTKATESTAAPWETMSSADAAIF